MSATRTASTYPVQFSLTAPLHHGAFEAGDTGNAIPFRRIPLAQDVETAVPVVSGNALRGLLRRVVMRDLFALCGLSRDTLPPIQWDKLYAALANGGHLDSAESRTDPAAQRALRDAVPALAVFGAALYSWMLAGKISVGWLWPVCRETITAGLCEGDAALVPGAEDLLTEISLVRHVDRDEQDPTKSGVTPMPVTVEALIPGTVLTTSIVQLRVLPPEELGVVGWALDQVRALGAKGGIGFGRCAIAHEIDATPYAAWRADADRVATARTTLIALAESMA